MKTLKELEKRLRDEPDNLGLRVTVASAMREAGRTRDAVELYRSVALAYRDQGRSLQAIAVCKNILAIAPDDARILALHAELLDPPPKPESDPFPPIPLVHKRAPVPSDPDFPPRRPEVLIPRLSSSDRLDETPLPIALPYHVADPTSSISRITAPQLGVRGSQIQMSSELDVTAELDTRQRRRVSTRELEKLAPPPQTQPIPRIDGPAPLPPPPARAPTARPQPITERDLEDIPTDDNPALTMPMNRIEDRDDADTSTGQHHDETTAEQSAYEEPEPLPPMRSSSSQTLTTTKMAVVVESDTEDELTQPRDTPFDPATLKPRAVDPLSTTFFSYMPVERRAAALSRFHRRAVKSGDVVIPRGAANHPFVIVLRGELEVRRDRARPYRVGPGEYAGEASLLARSASTATVVAANECQILVLLPADFYELVGRFPALWTELKDLAARRA